MTRSLQVPTRRDAQRHPSGPPRRPASTTHRWATHISNLSQNIRSAHNARFVSANWLYQIDG